MPQRPLTSVGSKNYAVNFQSIFVREQIASLMKEAKEESISLDNICEILNLCKKQVRSIWTLRLETLVEANGSQRSPTKQVWSPTKQAWSPKRSSDFSYGSVTPRKDSFGFSNKDLELSSMDDGKNSSPVVGNDAVFTPRREDLEVSVGVDMLSPFTPRKVDMKMKTVYRYSKKREFIREFRFLFKHLDKMHFETCDGAPDIKLYRKVKDLYKDECFSRAVAEEVNYLLELERQYQLQLLLYKILNQQQNPPMIITDKILDVDFQLGEKNELDGMEIPIASPVCFLDVIKWELPETIQDANAKEVRMNRFSTDDPIIEHCRPTIPKNPCTKWTTLINVDKDSSGTLFIGNTKDPLYHDIENTDLINCPDMYFVDKTNPGTTLRKHFKEDALFKPILNHFRECAKERDFKLIQKTISDSSNFSNNLAIMLNFLIDSRKFNDQLLCTIYPSDSIDFQRVFLKQYIAYPRQHLKQSYQKKINELRFHDSSISYNKISATCIETHPIIIDLICEEEELRESMQSGNSLTSSPSKSNGIHHNSPKTPKKHPISPQHSQTPPQTSSPQNTSLIRDLLIRESVERGRHPNLYEMTPQRSKQTKERLLIEKSSRSNDFTPLYHFYCQELHCHPNSTIVKQLMKDTLIQNHCIDLRYNLLGNKGCQALMKCVAHMKTCNTLLLQNQNLQAEAVAVICDTIRKNRSIRCLDLSKNELGVLSATSLLRMVKDCQHVTRVILVDTFIPKKYLNFIYEVLEERQGKKLVDQNDLR